MGQVLEVLVVALSQFLISRAVVMHLERLKRFLGNQGGPHGNLFGFLKSEGGASLCPSRNVWDLAALLNSGR